MESESRLLQGIPRRLSAAFDADVEGPRWSRLPRERRARIAIRLGILLGAAALLAYVCRNGSSLFSVAVAFVVYVAAATLWIRGQHQVSVDAAQQGNDDLRPWTFRYRYTASGLTAGLLLVGWGAAADFSEALIAGVLVAYLSAGYVLMRFRMYHGADALKKRVSVGKWLLVGSGVLVLVGLVALQYHWAALVALAVGLLIAPIGPSILAEPAIRGLQGQHSHTVLKVALLGAFILVVDIGVAMARINDEWAWVAIGAIALLFIAIVSSTQADIAAVIGAVTLMGVTPLSEEKPKALYPEPRQTRVLVALGDSYMSGEGAERFYVENGGRNYCHRAPTAWAAMAGQNTRLFQSVAFLACSGARTYNVQRAQTPPQPEVPRPQRQYDGARHTARPGRGHPKGLGRHAVQAVARCRKPRRQRRRVLDDRDDVPCARRLQRKGESVA